MARPQIPTINWRTELSRLDRFLQEDGGVVHIRTFKDSPSSAFAKALRSRMEYAEWAIPWQTIQFDGNNAATHYFGDMVHQIERSLGLASCAITGTPAVKIGADIKAGGDVHIHDISVNNVPHNAHYHDRAERIVTHLSTRYKEKRFGLIFFDSDNADQRELSAFRSVLWDEMLENHVSKGLLMIAFIGQGTSMPDWLPDPDEIIVLPDRYDDLSAGHAVEDLTAYAITQGLCASEEEAKMFAKTLVASNPKPKDLYANFAAVQLKIEQL